MSRFLTGLFAALALLISGVPAAAQSIGYSPNTLPLSGSCGVVTVSTPCLDLSQTWNNVATTFTGLKFNVTDTASAGGSMLMDLQVGGTSKFSVNKFGRVVIGDDLQANTAVSVTNNAGLFKLGASGDVVLARDAANTLALRNGTAAQAFNVYNTYTDASNYERATLRFSTNNAQLLVDVAGTGSGRALQFGVGGAPQWQLNTNGHFTATVDNTYDIGASGANRPRNLYIAGNFISGGSLYITSSGLLNWGSKGSIAQTSDGAYTFGNNAGTNSVTMTVGASNLATFNGGLTTSGTLTSGAGIVAGAAFRIGWAVGSQVYGGAVNGNIMLSNSGASDFGLLQFGGTTSSFPALKRSTTNLEVRLADDSAYAPFTAGNITAAGYVKTQSSKVAGLTAAATAGAGARSFVTDALGPTFGAAVVGGGAVSVPVYSDSVTWLVGDSGQDQLFDTLAANDNVADLYSLAA
jgi:hypothetical protein